MTTVINKAFKHTLVILITISHTKKIFNKYFFGIMFMEVFGSVIKARSCTFCFSLAALAALDFRLKTEQ